MERLERDRGGYSLVELVVSILMFALGFIGVVKMQQQAVLGNSFGLQMGNTLNIIESREEILRGLPLTDAALTLGAHTGGVETVKGIPYTLSWTVNTTGLGGAVDAREIELQVTWVEKAVTHRVVMDMYRSN